MIPTFAVFKVSKEFRYLEANGDTLKLKWHDIMLVVNSGILPVLNS